MDQNFNKIVESFKAINKCSSCPRYLNVVPIYTIYNDEKREFDKICGRCTHVVESFEKNNNNPKNRAHIYEKIASSISYPCWNERYGCKAKLNWGEVKKHEKKCLHQIRNCLFANDLSPNIKCSWKGSLCAFNKHVEEVHEDSILDNPKFEFEDDKENGIFFIPFQNVLVTVIIKYENEKYYYLLMVNVTDLKSKNYRCKLIFCDEEENDMLALFKNPLEPLYSYWQTIQNANKALKIDLPKIREVLQNPTNILIKFEIENNSEIEDPRLAFAKSFISSELQCPVCFSVMTAPIFVCNSGHSICSVCKVKLSKCPVCKSAFSNGRNYTLEKVLEKLDGEKNVPKKQDICAALQAQRNARSVSAAAPPAAAPS